METNIGAGVSGAMNHEAGWKSENNQWLLRVSKYLFYSIGFLIPLWFMPFSGSIDFSREVTFGILLFLAFILWLFHALFHGEFTYQKSLANIAVLLLLLIGALSAFFSKISYVAFFSTDIIGERYLSIIFYALAYFLATVVLTEKKDAMLMVFLMIGSSLVASVITLFGFFGIHLLPFSFAKRIDFNVVGTINALALFYGFMLVLVVGLLTSMRGLIHSMPRYLITGLWMSILLFFANLFVVNFLSAWIALFAGGLVLLWIYIRGSLNSYQEHGTFRNPYFFLLIGALLISIFFIVMRTPLFSSVQFSAEVSPSFQASMDISWKVLTENTKNFFFGSGPGTFAYNYSLYRDPIINQTVVWGVRFGQGYSWMATAFSTVGILGLMALAAFIFSSLGVIFRNLLRHENKNTLVSGLGAGIVFLFVTWFLYPANLTLLMTTFLVVGMLMSVISEDTAPFWGVSHARISFKTPWMVFGFSLAAVFLVAISVGGIYFESKRYIAATRFQETIIELQRTGNVDNGIRGLEKVVALDALNDQYQRFLAQGYLLKVQAIINSTLGGEQQPENVQENFRNTVTSAVNAIQTALRLNQKESFNWRTAGSIYETLIPLVQGADQSAINAYTEAANLDPTNPAIFVDLGRTHMTVSDTAQGLQNQRGLSADQLKQFSDLRTSSLTSGADVLQKAVSLKQDYAPGHFLLSQIAIRQGNIDLAISTTENARIGAPQDIGVAFQLGLLYYQKRQSDKAEAEFLRAVALSENYSNARYFLGLILDQKGKTQEAIQQFEKIESLNPDNQEVKQILSNLEDGKPALDGIAPPLPEKRSETPVKEEGGRESSPVQKKR